jgi:hypothetical protein
MCDKLLYLVDNDETVKAGMAGAAPGDNVAHMADWLAGEWPSTVKSGIVHAG